MDFLTKATEQGHRHNLNTRPVVTDELEVVYFFAGPTLSDGGSQLQTGLFFEDAELTCYVRNRTTQETSFLPISTLEEGMELIISWISNETHKC